MFGPWRTVLTFILLPASAFAQADNLGLHRSDILTHLKASAADLSVNLEPVDETCGPFACTWEIGEAVRLSATVMDGTFVYQLEAAWNTADKRSGKTSFRRFQDICHVIVAATTPNKSPAEREQIRKTLVTFEDSKGRALQPEERTSKVVFYGTKSRAADQSGTLYHCGSVANTSGRV